MIRPGPFPFRAWVYLYVCVCVCVCVCDVIKRETSAISDPGKGGGSDHTSVMSRIGFSPAMSTINCLCVCV